MITLTIDPKITSNHIDEALKEIFNKFNNLTVLISEDRPGYISGTRIINNFNWRLEPDIDGRKYIMIYSFPTEEYISIPLDKIINYQGHFQDGEQELIIKLEDNTILQIYIDE
ncbi:hypothetical protein [Clostridium arbusti]|uniref:hypothetical protein n=1 Tax=Clostridium arbusti TaxID=1137848 RepID=UPI000288CCF1|nr:hypothetical protein [Clostridium arbusti]